MAAAISRFEQQFFRRINGVVEPLVSRGVGSPSWTLASLIVLESIGFKSGQSRRTPLWSVRLGPYRLISTARGKRSFWVKNLKQRPAINYSLNGRVIDAEAIVIAPGYDNLDDWDLSPLMKRGLALLKQQAEKGWAFALLVPADD